MQTTMRERFERKVALIPFHPCHEWIGTSNSLGYGQFLVDGKKWYAHRAAWKIYRGDIPDRAYVCHRCDNPSCVNPDHLFIGTQLDNIRDCVNKGRLNSTWSRSAFNKSLATRLKNATTRVACKRGHEYAVHAYFFPSGKRSCRRCMTITNAARDKRLKEGR